MTGKYHSEISEIILHGKLFSDRFDGKKVTSIKEDEGLGRLEILFKDGSTIIHKGSYTIDFKKITKL